MALNSTNNADHSKHRERMRQKYHLDGLDVFSDHEILEFLLFYVIPRKNTNEIAHSLIDNFGSLSGVMDAPYGALRDFGLSDNAATFIAILKDLMRAYLVDKDKVRSETIQPDKLCDFFKNKFFGRMEEALYILLMDSNFRQLYCGVLSKGSINSTDVPTRRVIELSLLYNAKNVAIAHNHPFSTAIPSLQDQMTTQKMKEVLSFMGVNLVDHIVVSHSEEISIARSVFGAEIYDDKKAKTAKEAEKPLKKKRENKKKK